MVVPFLLIEKNWLLSIVSNQFTLDCLSTELDWSMLVYAGGLLVALGTIVAYINLKKNPLKALLIHSLFLSTSLLFVLYLLLPNVEKITQRPAIDFYQEHASDDAYIETVGFKSYAQYFYGQTMLNKPEQANDIGWLLTGEINKPAFFVTKSDNFYIDERFTEIDFLYQKGGFRFYHREVKN